MKAEEKILKFIKRFTGSPENEAVIETFTSGCCYWFAEILYQRFCSEYVDCAIFYDQIENHFVCRIKGKFWDITGEVHYPNAVLWDSFEDQLEKKRIIRNCIRF